MWKVNKDTGKSVSQIDPLAGVSVNRMQTFVAGPLTADANGNVYYNVIWLADPAVVDPWFGADVKGAWLVKVTSGDVSSIASYGALVPIAPAAGASCAGTFFDQQPQPAFPWPPSSSAVAHDAGMRIAAAGGECRTGGGDGRDDLHGEPGTLRSDGGVPGGGECGPDTEVADVYAVLVAGWLRCAAADCQRYDDAEQLPIGDGGGCGSDDERAGIGGVV